MGIRKSFTGEDYEAIRKAAEKFVDKFYCGGEFGEYVNGVGINIRLYAEEEKLLVGSGLTTIKSRIMRYCCAGCAFMFGNNRVENYLHNRLEKKIKKSGGKVDDWCITVSLKKPLPENLHLPEIYQGYAVVVIVRGEACLL